MKWLLVLLFVSISHVSIASDMVTLNKMYGTEYFTILGPFTTNMDTMLLYPTKTDQGQELVLGLKTPDSFLSLRTGPGTQYQEILKLNQYNVVNVIEISHDKNWAKINNISFITDMKGNPYSPPLTVNINLTGWVNVKYLFDFMMTENAPDF